MSSIGIVYNRVTPYYSSSNKVDENMVRSFKLALNKAHRSDSVESKIVKFLAAYRATVLL